MTTFVSTLRQFWCDDFRVQNLSPVDLVCHVAGVSCSWCVMSHCAVIKFIVCCCVMMCCCCAVIKFIVCCCVMMCCCAVIKFIVCCCVMMCCCAVIKFIVCCCVMMCCCAVIKFIVCCCVVLLYSDQLCDWCTCVSCRGQFRPGADVACYLGQ